MSHETVNIAPVILNAAHAARIEAATQALESAHNAVGDAAGAWYDEGERDTEERAEADRELRRAVEAWRAAGEALIGAMTGRGVVSLADLALSLRTSGEHVTVGGLPGLLALAGVRVESMRSDRDGWHALITRRTDLGRLAYEGTGATMALAIAAACEKAAS